MRCFHQHAARDKHLLRLDRERRRLWKAQGDAPAIPLEHPYQRGWLKTYILAERVLQRPDAAVFPAMLRAVNREVYSRNRTFVDHLGPIELHPLIIEQRQWLKLAWPASHRRWFGYGMWRDTNGRCHAWRRTWIQGFKLMHPWWLEETILPRMITHQRVDLPEVKSRLAEIEAYLTHTAGRNRLHHLYGRSRWWHRHVTSYPTQRENEIRTGHLREISFADT